MRKDKRRSLYGARGWRLNKKALVQDRARLGGTAANEQAIDLAISSAPPNQNAKTDGVGLDSGQRGTSPPQSKGGLANGGQDLEPEEADWTYFPPEPAA